MAPREVRTLLLCSLAPLALACSRDEVDRRRAPEESEDDAKTSRPAKKATLEDLVSLVDEARSLGEKTWPGARLGGVRVAEEVPPGARSNLYSVRVRFHLDAKAHGGPPSASVVCSPKCQTIEHKVTADAVAWPKCSLSDALKVARGAGLGAERPVVGYGSWGDGPWWTFRSSVDDASGVEVDGESCKLRAR